MSFNIFDVVGDLLKTNEKYVAEDGKLLKAVVYSDVMNMDSVLLEMLLSNEIVKDTFFTNVSETLIFDKQKFAWFMDSKEFLPDSYTRFTNKIGLTSNGEFVSKNNDVVLDFPYKDCVLEGGQDKEDQRRKEIFYNETIASDEIRRMLAPKVLSNAKRYTADGVEGNIEFSNEDNLIIKGNNLIALSSLLKRYEGKVKCIYIDPPYNTGNDSFRYNDTFNHSTWLTFMKNRLNMAYKLLASDGSIYVQIDNNESAYLKVLLDEIFGKENFRAEIIWVLEGASGYKSLAQNYIRGHDTIYFYSKSEKYTYNKRYLPYSDKQLARFSSVDESGRKYKSITKTRRLYLDEAKGVPLTDVWTDIASFQTIVNSPERTGFETQKPEKLIERLLSCSTNEGDLVLDFHLGSGTTCSVAHKMKLKYIGIEQMEDQLKIALERLPAVINSDQSGVSKALGWQGGGSFVYCELLEDAQVLVAEIQNADDTQINHIKSMVFKDDRIVPYITKQELINVDNSFEELSLEDKKKALISLIDKNKLYVNVSDMNDESIHISESDKQFTESFYKEV